MFLFIFSKEIKIESYGAYPKKWIAKLANIHAPKSANVQIL